MHTEIHQLLAPYLQAPVECDGFTRLAHTALVNAGIEHKVLFGKVVSVDGTKELPIHFWIELPDGHVIDYKARMWLGNADDVPHGIFGSGAFPGWEYCGEAFEMSTLSPLMVLALMMPVPRLHELG